ncbi:hypothetical protein KRMM14A1259_00710 [Krasilnikovia sp. MM14-A1259]
MLRRRCVCGLKWPCLDLRLQPQPLVRPSWADAPTEVLPQRGWVVRLTPAQAWRANGGRR